MELIRNGWFSEINSMWPGQCMSLEVEKVLMQEKSKYQDVMVFKSKTYGNVLVLDGVIQCTERDEFSYQEMIVHLPLNSHPNPKKVLVIGGGDGGVIREIVKHDCVESITQCEIDEKVIEVSKKYFPNMSSGYDNDKVYTYIGDGFQFMKEHENEYDVIITDSTDPDGPAETLFNEEYYKLMKNALRENGIVCFQEDCVWLGLDHIHEVQNCCRSLFPVVDYGYCTIPTYPSGQGGFLMCSKNEESNFRIPVRNWSEEEKLKLNLKYYNEDIHRAAFVFPEFARKKFQSKIFHAI